MTTAVLGALTLLTRRVSPPSRESRGTRGRSLTSGKPQPPCSPHSPVSPPPPQPRGPASPGIPGSLGQPQQDPVGEAGAQGSSVSLWGLQAPLPTQSPVRDEAHPPLRQGFQGDPRSRPSPGPTWQGEEKAEPRPSRAHVEPRGRVGTWIGHRTGPSASNVGPSQPAVPLCQLLGLGLMGWHPGAPLAHIQLNALPSLSPQTQTPAAAQDLIK